MSRTAFCSPQPALICAARQVPIPATLSRRFGSPSMISKVFSPNWPTIRCAGFRPDPFDHARPEIARNALYRGRWCRVKPSGLKLPPVVAVHDPGADRLNEFTSRQGRGVADHGHKLPLALRLHLEDDEAVVFVVVCDALNHARECLAGLIIGPLCGAVSPHGSWPRRPIGDRRPGKSFSIRIDETRPSTQGPRAPVPAVPCRLRANEGKTLGKCERFMNHK